MTVSAAMAAVVTRQHSSYTRAEVYAPGRVLTGMDLRVVGGSSVSDATTAVRGRMEMTVVDHDGSLMAQAGRAALGIYGSEVRLYRGIVGVGDAPLGVFRVSQIEIDGLSGEVRLTGYDRSRVIALNRFTAPYPTGTGITYHDAIRAIVTARLKQSPPFNFTESTQSSRTLTMPFVFDTAGDPWEAVQRIADSIGHVVYFAADGSLVSKPRPDPATDLPVWTFNTTNSIVTSITNSLSDEPGYNGFVVDAEPPDGPPFHAEVWDRNPTSPTVRGGNYEDRPAFLRSNMILDQAQADEAARAGFLRTRGISEQLNIDTVPIPGLDAGEVVQVTFPSVGLDAAYLVDSITMPLSAEGTMRVSAKRRRFA